MLLPDLLLVDCVSGPNMFYQAHATVSLYILSFSTDLLDYTPYNITITPIFDAKTGHGTRAWQICSRIGCTYLVLQNVF